MTGALEVTAPGGVGEIVAGDDLAALVLEAFSAVGGLRDGDIVTVTSKVVSKAEGRTVAGTREDALPGETVRVVARRGPTTIVRNRQGLTMAAAGIDGSHVAPGQVLLLPEDPDASARAIRHALVEASGACVGVLLTDTAGRAWREGQTDLAIGAAGVTVLESFAGKADTHGNELAVTEPAVADELAAAVELASGKLGGRPFARVRGRADLVLPADDDGPGAAALVRPDGGDLFGLGTREAVVAALAGRDAGVFGARASAEDLGHAVADVLGGRVEVGDARVTTHLSDAAGREVEAAETIGFAFGWEPEVTATFDAKGRPSGIRVRFLPAGP